MNIIPYQDGYQEDWDNFILSQSWNGNFLHTRRYLSYHRQRFKDISLIVQNRHGKVVAVFPCAENPDDAGCAISHPGITYGGLAAGADLRGDDCIDAIAAVADYYQGLGYQHLIYKAVPYIYHKHPYQDDIYALFRMGAKRYRCDLSSCIVLNSGIKISRHHIRNIRKAIRSQIKIVDGQDYINEIWQIIEDKLWNKYQSKPIHSVEEIRLLQKLFPENIKFMAAMDNNEVVAGLVLFIMDDVFHVQYPFVSNFGQKVSAIHLLYESAIRIASNQNKRYFDIGTSNENEGAVLNQSLFRFKANFGCGSVVHEYYDLNLRNP